MLNAFAVFKLIMDSNFVGCSIGKSPGRPAENLSDILGCLAINVSIVGTVTEHGAEPVIGRKKGHMTFWPTRADQRRLSSTTCYGHSWPRAAVDDDQLPDRQS